MALISISIIWASFHMFMAFHIFLWWSSNLLHILKTQVSYSWIRIIFRYSVYKWSHPCFTNVFSQSVASLFIFLTVFEEQNLKILINFSYQFFSYMVHSLCVLPKKSLPNPQSQISVFIQLFYSFRFYIRSMMHFEMIFVNG